ncbi:MAG: hypothetical protein MPJ50_10850 [Pirellulales bacterium]|nr:hypothetical protein [Pirellulales bacterium]
MSESDQPSSSSADSIRAADALPPVEPPDPGLILKLFFVPGIIVFIVVLLVLGVTALVSMGGDPMERLAAIERGSANAWQEAESIANELRSSDELRSNEKFNARMAAFLQRKLQDPLPAGDADELNAEIKLRVFLCKCLGEFDIPGGLPALYLAATPPQTGTEEEGLDVRQASIEAIALVIHKVRAAGGDLPEGQIFEFLEARSREGGAADKKLGRIRSRAAYALGVLGGDQAVVRLKEMLTLELYADARFNAATGVARWGAPECLETLVEMIDPDTIAPLEDEEIPEARDLKRWMMRSNGIKGAELLAKENPEIDLSSLPPVVKKLQSVEGLPVRLNQQATQLLNVLRERSP